MAIEVLGEEELERREEKEDNTRWKKFCGFIAASIFALFSRFSVSVESFMMLIQEVETSKMRHGLEGGDQ